MTWSSICSKAATDFPPRPARSWSVGSDVCSEDEFDQPDVTELYPQRLRLRADDVEFHLLEGGHRFPSKAGPLVERWIARVF
jgi:hypothetical protein